MAFEPENELETLLIRATREPDARRAFSRALLEAEVFVALFGPTPDTPLVEPGTNAVRPGLKLAERIVPRNGASYSPIFSAASRVWAMTRDNHIVARQQTRELFSARPGAYFLLNPGSDYGKEFFPGEIGDLLAGRESGPRETITAAGTQMLVGTPADYPHAFVAALGRALLSMPEVDAAYLSQAMIPGQQPGLMLELRSSAQRETLLAKIGPLIEAPAPPGRPVNVHVAADAAALSSARIVAPFFVKKSGGLRRFFPFLSKP